jgi:hypothetical protein
MAFFRKNKKHTVEIKNEPIAETSLKQKVKSKYDEFYIEYLPAANKYLPRYKRMYLYWCIAKKNYSLESNINGCVFSDTKEEAKAHIDKYLELRGIGSVIIKIDED